MQNKARKMKTNAACKKENPKNWNNYLEAAGAEPGEEPLQRQNLKALSDLFTYLH